LELGGHRLGINGNATDGQATATGSPVVLKVQEQHCSIGQINVEWVKCAGELVRLETFRAFSFQSIHLEGCTLLANDRAWIRVHAGGSVDISD
jgi:hypothetical protein